MVIRKIITAIAFLALPAIVPAVAQSTVPATFTCHGNSGPTTFTMPAGVQPICSKNFFFAGTCNGQDQVPIMNENWEGADIVIVGVTHTFYQVPGGIQYVFDGNSDIPDIMLWTGAGQNYGSHSYPAGTGMLFRNNGSHVDIHVACGSGSYAGQQIIDYIPTR